MRRTAAIGGRVALAAVALWTLAACGEKPQTLGAAPRQDSPPYTGPGGAFTAPGWTPGDKASWERALRVRNQHQNDYSRAN